VLTDLEKQMAIVFRNCEISKKDASITSELEEQACHAELTKAMGVLNANI